MHRPDLVVGGEGYKKSKLSPDLEYRRTPRSPQELKIVVDLRYEYLDSLLPKLRLVMENLEPSDLSNI